MPRIQTRGASYGTEHWAQYKAGIEDLVLEDPVVLTRKRDVFADKFRAPLVDILRLVARVDQFRISRTNVRFDEKGTSAVSAYIMLGVNNPTNPRLVEITSTSAAVSSIGLDDLRADEILADAVGRRFRVMTPTRFTFGVFEVNLELLG